jgi:hypothetical protein
MGFFDEAASASSAKQTARHFGGPQTDRRIGLRQRHTRMGQVCGNVNRNLKWAFVETGNLIVINQRGLAGTHVIRLYQTHKTCQESPEGGGRGGAPLGRGRLVGAHQAGGLSRAPRLAASSFVDARVSAVMQLTQRG